MDAHMKWVEWQIQNLEQYRKGEWEYPKIFSNGNFALGELSAVSKEFSLKIRYKTF